MATSKQPSCGWDVEGWDVTCVYKYKIGVYILLMAEILHQLRLVVFPIIYRVPYIPGGAGFQPSTVWLYSHIFICTDIVREKSRSLMIDEHMLWCEMVSILKWCGIIQWYIFYDSWSGPNDKWTANRFFKNGYGVSSLHRIETSLEINETSPPFRGWTCLKVWSECSWREAKQCHGNIDKKFRVV